MDVAELCRELGVSRHHELLHAAAPSWASGPPRSAHLRFVVPRARLAGHGGLRQRAALRLRGSPRAHAARRVMNRAVDPIRADPAWQTAMECPPGTISSHYRCRNGQACRTLTCARNSVHSISFAATTRRTVRGPSRVCVSRVTLPSRTRRREEHASPWLGFVVATGPDAGVPHGMGPTATGCAHLPLTEPDVTRRYPGPSDCQPRCARTKPAVTPAADQDRDRDGFAPAVADATPSANQAAARVDRSSTSRSDVNSPRTVPARRSAAVSRAWNRQSVSTSPPTNPKHYRSAPRVW